MDAKDQIKQQLDLVEVIQEYIQMKPAGTHAFKALCPFHQEKTPSFHVSRDKQIWRCFGCDVGGDMFSFVMQMEGVDFPEALRILGKKAGVEVKRFTTTNANEKQKIYKLQQFATAYYHKVLSDASYGQVARDYCSQRGLSGDLLEKFQLGFAPDDWDSFSRLARQKGFSEKDLLAGGLSLNRKTGVGIIDRFRNRLMIPLSDAHGSVVGFTGRILASNDQRQATSGPKYMNSPETLIYKKGQLLYGLALAKQAIRKEDSVIICEGNLDVISSHKAGVKNIVASSGTALTEAQLNLLRRFTTNLIFCFDADAAGFNAAQRGIHLAQSMGFNVSVLIIPESLGKDPDDVVQKNPSAWKEIAQRPLPIMEYYFEQATKGKDLTNVDDKREIGKLLLSEIAGLEDTIEKEHWLQKLALLLRMDKEVLRPAMKVTKNIETEEHRNRRTEPESEARKPIVVSRKPIRSRRERVARLILGIFIEQKELRAKIMDQLKPKDFPEGNLETIYKTSIQVYTQDNKPALKSFYEQLKNRLTNEEDQKLLDELVLSAEVLSEQTLDRAQEQLDEAISYLKEQVVKIECKNLLSQIRLAEDAGDSEQAEQLLKQYHALR